ncbi:MAG: enoyl-ACP reductase FabI [Dongiaceae bacterium]
MGEQGGLMAGKRGLIMGVANDRSIAWGIARAVAEQGGEIAFTYQGDALGKRVLPLAQSIGADFVVPCDVGDDGSVDSVFAAIAERWGRMDFLVHAIAFSDKEELKGKYINTSRSNFATTLDISCYSFTAVCQRAVQLMPDGGSLLTLTYYGAERVMPHYNVMGVAKAALESSVRYLAADLGGQNIRVNAISAGPIKTLAASGIGDFRYILRWNELNSPLKRNVTTDQVGGAGLYLLSHLSAGVTGEVHHVDSGYHVVGMLRTESAPEVAELLQGFDPKS